MFGTRRTNEGRRGIEGCVEPRRQRARFAWRPLVLASVAATAAAQITRLESVSARGVAGNGHSELPQLSGDGRFVGFSSSATNLVASDANGATPDALVRDRWSGMLELVSRSSSGAQANGASFVDGLSTDGRFVVFESDASNLVALDTNGRRDVFVHDRATGTTERVSVSGSGAQGNDDSVLASISDDGRFVAFASFATNLVALDTNGWSDIFVRDRVTGTTTRVSVSSTGAQANFVSWEPSLSDDGRFVAFRSAAWNLVPGDTNASDDVFVHERAAGTTTRVSLTNAGAQPNGGSLRPSISADGRFVAFDSTATNLVAGDTNGVGDVFVRDRTLGTTVCVSRSSSGVEANGFCTQPVLSADGGHVAFYSDASNLVAGDLNGGYDVFVHDRAGATTVRASVASDGTEGNGTSAYPSLSADGRFVAFHGDSSNLAAGDDVVAWDVFVRDGDAAGFESACEPGSAGVSACPCSNPPSGPGRGCDNSAATGGARLTTSGAAYLTADTLTFTVTGTTPNALAILIQCDATDSLGAPFGQGVTCVAGTLVRLVTKAATSGVVVAPDWGAGDVSISARSAAKGHPIQAGESRWYALVYRDATVLGGCPSASTRNVSQTGRVSWSL